MIKKSMVKIFLIHIPNIKNRDYEELIIPNGLLYIYNFLKKQNSKVEIGVLFSDCVDEFVECIDNNTIIGFSVNSSNKNIVFETAKKIKSVNKNIITVAGGPFITLAPDEFLNKINSIDYFFKGEGEVILSEFLKSSNKFEKISRASRIENLDEIGFPAQSDLIYSNILTSRGCPGSCIYCSSKMLWDRKIKLRSAESVVSEINLLYNKNIDYFVFSDDTFTINKKRTFEILDGIKQNKIIFDLRSRTDFISDNMAEKLAEAGCVSVSFGIESGSPSILSTLNKNICLDKSIDVINDFKKNGILVNLFFIVGNPGETEKDIVLTQDFIKKARPDWITVYGLHYYPGCELAEKYPAGKNLLTNQESVYYDNPVSIDKKKQALYSTFNKFKNIKNFDYYKNIDSSFRIKFRFYDFAGDNAKNEREKINFYTKALEYYESPEIMYKIGVMGNKKMLKKAAEKFYFQLSNDIRKSEDFIKNCKICFDTYGNRDFIDFVESEFL